MLIPRYLLFKKKSIKGLNKHKIIYLTILSSPFSFSKVKCSNFHYGLFIISLITIHSILIKFDIISKSTLTTLASNDYLIII